jgi:hypothetical protein
MRVNVNKASLAVTYNMPRFMPHCNIGPRIIWPCDVLYYSRALLVKVNIDTTTPLQNPRPFNFVDAFALQY